MEKYEASMIAGIILGTVFKGSDYANLVNLVANLSFLSYSRENEFEADSLGIRFCYRAGYNPTKGLKIFKHFAELSGSGDYCDYFSTHPNPDSRIENAIALMNGIDQAGGVTAYDLQTAHYDYISVSGTWDTEYGKVMLTQDDADIYGLFEDKLLKFEGEITAKGVEIEWEDLRDQEKEGKALLALNKDGSIISGKWYLDGEGETSEEIAFNNRILYDGPNISANRYAALEFKGIDLEVAGAYFISKANDKYLTITGAKEGSTTFAQNEMERCRLSCLTPEEAEFEENWGYKTGAFTGVKEFSFDLPTEVITYADRAIECFELASAEDPENTDLLLEVGIARVWKEDIDGGLACFEKIIALDPGYTQAYINAGDCYLYRGDDVKAIGLYRDASAADPKNHVAYNRLGVYYYSKGQYEMALEQFQLAAKTNVKDYADYSNAALCYYKMGDMDKAQRQIDFATTFNEEYAPIFYYQGKLYMEKGEIGKAEKSFLKGIEVNRLHAGSYYELAQLYFDECHYQESRAYFSKYQYLFPSGSHNKDAEEHIIALNTLLGESDSVAMDPSDMIKTVEEVPEDNTGTAISVSGQNNTGSSGINASDSLGGDNLSPGVQTQTGSQPPPGDVSMAQPSDEEVVDMLVTPGVGVGLVVELGENVDDFKAILGEPDSVRPFEGGSVYYLYKDTQGLNIVCKEKTVDMIAVFGDNYKTEGDIRVGASAEKVMEVFGDNYLYEELVEGILPGTPEKDANLSYKLNYEGVSFVFDKENRVALIIFTSKGDK